MATRHRTTFSSNFQPVSALNEGMLLRTRSFGLLVFLSISSFIIFMSCSGKTTFGTAKKWYQRKTDPNQCTPGPGGVRPPLTKIKGGRFNRHHSFSYYFFIVSIMFLALTASRWSSFRHHDLPFANSSQTLKIVLTCCEYRRFLEQMHQVSKEVPGPGMYEPQHQNARIRGGKISQTSSLTHWQILDKHGTNV